MSVISYRQKIMLGDREPVMLLRGQRQSGLPFFAYVELSMDKLAKLNADMEAGKLVALSEYGRVVLSGEGEPDEAQKEYMTRHYAFFDHSDPFAEEEAASA